MGGKTGLLPIELAQLHLREVCGADRQGRASMQQRSVQAGTAPVPLVELVSNNLEFSFTHGPSFFESAASSSRSNGARVRCCNSLCCSLQLLISYRQPNSRFLARVAASPRGEIPRLYITWYGVASSSSANACKNDGPLVVQTTPLFWRRHPTLRDGCCFFRLTHRNYAFPLPGTQKTHTSSFFRLLLGRCLPRPKTTITSPQSGIRTETINRHCKPCLGTNFVSLSLVCPLSLSLFQTFLFYFYPPCAS